MKWLIPTKDSRLNSLVVSKRFKYIFWHKENRITKFRVAKFCNRKITIPTLRLFHELGSSISRLMFVDFMVSWQWQWVSCPTYQIPSNINWTLFKIRKTLLDTWNTRSWDTWCFLSISLQSSWGGWTNIKDYLW